MIRLASSLLVVLFSVAPLVAQQTNGDALGGLVSNNNSTPVKIDANALDVFEKENRAVFRGNVVAVQGDSTVRCSSLTIHYEAPPKGATVEGSSASPANNAIRKMECKGPVTVVSKDQVASGDNAVFDRGSNRVVLTGNVSLSQGRNVTRGERIVYDMNTGIASVQSGNKGRVRALFVPNATQ